jgi:hypothetical protein
MLGDALYIAGVVPGVKILNICIWVMEMMEIVLLKYAAAA